MKKKNLIIFILIVITLGLITTGCCGERIESDDYSHYQVLVNAGSVFGYTFKDEETGVWYVCGRGGITPRLNADGSLYKDLKECRYE